MIAAAYGRDDDAPMGSSLRASAMRAVCEKQEDGLRWVLVRELQLACVEVCAGCRQAAPFRVRINESTPRRLWAPQDGNVEDDSNSGAIERGEEEGESSNTGNGISHNDERATLSTQPTPGPWPLVLGAWGRWVGSVSALFGTGARGGLPAGDSNDAEEGGDTESHPPPGPPARGVGRSEDRVPKLRVISVVWEGSVGDMEHGDLLPSELEELLFYQDFDESVDEVRWPGSVKTITFGRDFTKPVGGVQWPPLLEVLRFGFHWNGSLDGVLLPSRLKTISFDWHFNQSLDGVTFPSSLRELSFGYKFNRHLDSAKFPSGLAKISFGETFDQEIFGVTWPSGLESLTFGRRFNKNLRAVVLPAGLKEIKFGENFEQLLQDVVWPDALEAIDLGGCSSGIEQVTWPASVRRLKLGKRFNGTVGEWLPPALTHLTFGPSFEDVPVVDVLWPRGLESLVFTGNFNQEIEGVVWPETLKTLSLSFSFNQPLDRVVWPSALERIELGRRFTGCVDRVTWPVRLNSLKLDTGMHLWEGVQWPPGVDVEFSWKQHHKYDSRAYCC